MLFRLAEEDLSGIDAVLSATYDFSKFGIALFSRSRRFCTHYVYHQTSNKKSTPVMKSEALMVEAMFE